VVAGLLVESGKLRLSNPKDTYIYHITRNGQLLLEDFAGKADLKRFKDKVGIAKDVYLCVLPSS
jgi:hypothetical protein